MITTGLFLCFQASLVRCHKYRQKRRENVTCNHPRKNMVLQTLHHKKITMDWNALLKLGGMKIGHKYYFNPICNIVEKVPFAKVETKILVFTRVAPCIKGALLVTWGQKLYEFVFENSKPIISPIIVSILRSCQKGWTAFFYLQHMVLMTTFYYFWFTEKCLFQNIHV